MQLVVRATRRPVQLEGPEQSWSCRTARFSVKRKYFVLPYHRMEHESTSCVLPNCWPTYKRAETTRWTRSLRACRRSAGSNVTSEVKEFHRGGQSRGGNDGRHGEELEGDKGVKPKFNMEIYQNTAGRVDAANGRGRKAAHRHQHRPNGYRTMEPPHVDEAWHSICQAICK